MMPWSRILGGSLLVAGTTIGVAMLVMPIATGLAGFGPTVAILGLFWLYMTFAAFCMLEANLWLDGDANIISMARLTMGRRGEWVCWGAYLFLLYALTTAYISVSAPILDDFVETATGWNMPDALAPIPIVLTFAAVIYRGIGSIDHLNRFLMVGLVTCYFLLCYLIFPHVSAEKLAHSSWCYAGLGVSIIATAFGYHIIIPSLNHYMKKDIRGMKWVLILGGLAPLLVNVVWEFLSLGVLPLEGEHGIIEAFSTGASSALLIRHAIEETLVVHSARFFAFFAICTSFLGVTLSLSDFLLDGLKIPHTSKGRLKLCVLTFIPPLFWVWMNPRASLTALQYAGVVGVVLLLGVMPALMVWFGRYRRGLPHAGFRVPGGKVALGGSILFGLMVIVLQVCIQTGLYVCPILQ